MQPYYYWLKTMFVLYLDFLQLRCMPSSILLPDFVF